VKRCYHGSRGRSRRVASGGIGRQRACAGLGSRRATSNGIGSGMCVHKSEKSKRQWLRNYQCQNQGGMCYRHNLTGPKDGPRVSWAEGKHGNSLQISFCANVSRARMAVYLRCIVN
jgi:hypothetical protein